MQDFAMRTYNYIVDFLVGVRVHGCCIQIKKQVLVRKFIAPLIFSRRF